MTQLLNIERGVDGAIRVYRAKGPDALGNTVFVVCATLRPGTQIETGDGFKPVARCSDAEIIAAVQGAPVQEKQDSAVVSALLRLHRAGSEHSRTTQKLRDAAKVAGEVIVSAVLDSGIDMERNGAWRELELPLFAHSRYRVSASATESWFEIDCGLGEYDWQVIYTSVSDPAIHYAYAAAIHKFSADIADGLLDEIAAFLEKRTAENEAAAATLEATKV